MESLLNIYKERLDNKISEREARCKWIANQVGESGSLLMQQPNLEHTISALEILITLNAEIKQLDEIIQSFEFINLLDVGT